MMYPLLHETLNVGSLVLKNRLVLPPMATEKSAKGQVTDGLVAYYGDMARSGPGTGKRDQYTINKSEAKRS